MTEKNKLALSEAEGIVPQLRFPEFEEEWDNTNLGSIGKPLMCKRIFKEETTSNPVNAIPFFKIGTFGAEPDAYIPIELYEQYKKKYSFPKIGDILISASGTIGRLVVYDGADAYYQDSNIVWLGHNEKKVLNSYLYHCYSTLKWQTSDGGVIKRLYNSNLKEMEIFYPKTPKEQQKIAACLSSLDEVITAETEKLDLLQDHKKGLLQQLFPAEGETQPKFRFPEFKDDGDWEEHHLGKICKYFNGGSHEKNVTDDGEYYLISLNSIDIEGNLKEEMKRVSHSDNSLVKNDLVMVLSDVAHGNFLGLCAIIPNEKYVLNQRMAGLRLRNKNVNVEFLRFFINNNQKYFKRTGQGSSQQNLAKSSVENFPVLLPKDPKEQQKIAACLSAADALIEAQDQKIQALQEHKKGLLQQLFPQSITNY